jgi:CBS domain-containing protein
MFVRDRMSSPAVTVRPDTPFQEALKLMRARFALAGHLAQRLGAELPALQA